MRVELHGLRLQGRHGVLPEERRDGQTFVYDVELEVGERGADDRIEHAVDYREVAALVAEVNGRRFDLLEALASALADELLARFDLDAVKVRVAKPEVQLPGTPVGCSAVTVERSK